MNRKRTGTEISKTVDNRKESMENNGSHIICNQIFLFQNAKNYLKKTLI